MPGICGFYCRKTYKTLTFPWKRSVPLTAPEIPSDWFAESVISKTSSRAHPKPLKNWRHHLIGLHGLPQVLFRTSSCLVRADEKMGEAFGARCRGWRGCRLIEERQRRTWSSRNGQVAMVSGGAERADFVEGCFWCFWRFEGVAVLFIRWYYKWVWVKSWCVATLRTWRWKM